MNDYSVKRGTSRRKKPVPNILMYHLPNRHAKDDDKQVECGTESWPTEVTCPDCKKSHIRWAEDGYVPGHRICPVCGSHWSLEAPASPGGQWILRRARFYS